MCESIYYNYKLTPYLINDIDSIDKYVSINLCIYSVNTEGKLPFINYLLTDNGYSFLSIPQLPPYKLFSKETLVSYSEVYLSSILNVGLFEDFKNKVIFNGFYEYNDNLYLFFDVTHCNIDDNNVKYVLIDELINYMDVCNMSIDVNACIFFRKNHFLCDLYNENDKLIEVPIVGYVSKQSEQKAKFTMMFRETAKNKSAIMGPFFYFTNVENAIKQFNNELYKNIYLVRFALFLGETNYVENNPNDPNDCSEIKKERLNDQLLDKKKEIMTLRISDHDGNWSKNYDSIYLGKLELDDGSFLENTPLFVLKDYSQQIPLSMHIV